jgi:hypothetical protein
MRLVPFTFRTVLAVAVMVLLPVSPLVLTMFSRQELIERMLQGIF